MYMQDETIHTVAVLQCSTVDIARSHGDVGIARGQPGLDDYSFGDESVRRVIA
jgi:hypothetical protein